jgi:hypothetical protein
MHVFQWKESKTRHIPHTICYCGTSHAILVRGKARWCKEISGQSQVSRSSLTVVGGKIW